MLYLANPSTAGVRDAMAAGQLGAIMSPRQGNRLPGADGTYLTYAPDANLPRLLGWLREIHSQAALWAAA